MFVYFLIFIILAILAIEYEIKPIQKKEFTLIIIAVLLSLFAGLRDEIISRDYNPYLNSFNAIMHGGAKGGSGFLPLFEPGFLYIVIFCYNIFERNGAIAVMLMFAFLSVTTKMYVIRKLPINPFLVLLLYYSHYYFFQEMTQIRNGLACSFFFLAILFYLEDQRWKVFFLILLGMLFHISSILYFLIFFLRKDSLNGYVYGGLFLLSVIFGLMRIPIVSLISGFNLNLISNKLATYVSIVEEGYFDNIRFFNVLNIFNVSVTGYMFYYCLRYKIKNPQFILFIKFNIIAIFIYGLLIGVTSVAARFAELFGAVFPFLFAYGAKVFPFKKLNIFFVIGIAVVFFYINLIYGKLLGPYSIISFK